MTTHKPKVITVQAQNNSNTNNNIIIIIIYFFIYLVTQEPYGQLRKHHK